MERWRKPFFTMSLFLLNRVPEKWWEKQGSALEEKLHRLYPERMRETARSYYAKRLSLVLAGMFFSVLFLTVLSLFTGEEEEKIGSLRRPVYGQGSLETELEVTIEGQEEKVSLALEVSERRYTPEEVQVLLNASMKELEEIIPGENENLDEVRKDLLLPKSLKEDAVKIQWVMTPSDLIDVEGKRLREPDEEGELVELQGHLSCQGQEAEYTCYARIFPPIRTSQENLLYKLSGKIQEADKKEQEKEQLSLPEDVDGRRVSFSKPEEHIIGVLALVLSVCILCLWIWQDQQMKEREKERQRQLVLDYPGFLLQLEMLLGAGLTIRGAFGKMASAYEKKRKKKISYVYEEVRITCWEMEHGVGEADAYETFGRRCQISGYVKLGSILSQHLKKGTTGLSELLRQEAISGLEERRNLARRLGEEAGTKLLLPMILMLLIVLIILVVPAFFQL